MAQLNPAPFRDLVTRLHREPDKQGTLFQLPRARWYLPDPNDPDLSVASYGVRAANPSGPAAGPHTQMAQSILLSYVAGGRILELKTVQEDEQAPIPQPRIDLANVGFNVERPQELCIAHALREYAAGSMLIVMFRHDQVLTGGRLDGLAGAAICDIGIGYDLAGIRRDKVRGFLDGMRLAGATVDRLRSEIPREFGAARDLPYATRLAGSVTLSTFHGCPAGEIESICELLIADHDYDVTIKMNPPTLGKQRLEHLLHDVLGYTRLRVAPQAYAAGLTLDEAVGLCGRLTRFADKRGRRVGFKFCNPLEALNRGAVLPPDSEAGCLSGQPLHVIAMTLVDEFRRKVGPHVPISFSAGIDRANFPLAVACGFVPVSACTDLLRPGGYGRLSGYLRSLVKEMQRVDAVNINEFILGRFGQDAEARRRALAESGEEASSEDLQAAVVRWAGLLNTSIVAKMACKNRRYRADRNRLAPGRVASQLETFDCNTCEQCITVCPNAASFTYPTPVVGFDCPDAIVSPDGSWRDGPRHDFKIASERQIGCYADFCNECGNCGTFCTEHGSPHLKKPSFFSGVESWEEAAPRDGFVVHDQPEGGWIRARIDGRVYQLTYVAQTQQYLFDDGTVEALLSGWGHQIIGVRVRQTLKSEHRLDLRVYHLLRYLRAGVLDERQVNQINVQWMIRTRWASGAPR